MYTVKILPHCTLIPHICAANCAETCMNKGGVNEEQDLFPRFFCLQYALSRVQYDY
jgi:hypothetical protein